MSVDEDLAGSAAVEPAAEAAACGSREAPSDDADAQQQQPLAAGGPDCSDWDDDDDDDVTGSESEWEAAGAHAGPLLTPEEEEEKKLRILRCCTPLVKAIHGVGNDEEPLAKRQRCSPAAGAVAPPRCINPACGADFRSAAELAVTPVVEFTKGSYAVHLRCRLKDCGRRQRAACQGSSHAGVGEGDVVWWRASGSGGGQQPGTVQYGLVTGLHQGKRSVAAWHLQLLSTSLALPECSCPILNERAFLLTAGHTRLPLETFALAWQHGRAGVVQAPLLYYMTRQWELLSLPADCPRYGSCRSEKCRCHGCTCLNPQMAHDGRAFHIECCDRSADGPALEAGDAACLVGGVRYAVGDLVFCVPPEEELGSGRALDVELELGRIQELRLGLGESQGDSQVLGALEPRVQVSYRRYQRTSSAEGHTYSPVPGPGGLASCSAEHLRGLVDDLRLKGLGARLATAASSSSAGGSGGSGGGGEASGHAEPASSCDAQERQRQERLQSAMEAGPSRRTVQVLDLFSGWGGLSSGVTAGLRQAGLQASTMAGVDMFPAALQTFADQHPGAQTFCEDACHFLEGIRGGRKEEGKAFPKRGCPQGVVRVLVGGPPCQGFSAANTSEAPKKEAKNMLVFLYLSVLEELQWPFAIMENVAGLLTAGVLPLIIQWAASAGYQCCFRLLQAGSHGVGEHRRRFILILAKHGLAVPRFPEPSTLFPAAGGRNCSLAARKRSACSGVPKVWRTIVQVPGPAPLPALTARDVLADLPTDAAAAGEQARYACAPHGPFAAVMRAGPGLAEAGAEVSNHHCLDMRDEVRARIAAIPREGDLPGPGALAVQTHPFRPARAGNWWDLPERLLPPSLAEKWGQRVLEGVYARLLWSSMFATLLTDTSLYSSSTSTILHPVAHRPLTVREYARVQGVPDCVTFSGTTVDAYKQVGNCVPPPLGAALGRELGRAILQAAEAGQL